MHGHTGSAGTYLAEILLFPNANVSLLLQAKAFGGIEEGIEEGIEQLLVTSIADRLFRNP